MPINSDAGVLDDPESLRLGDPAGMLRAVATSAAQVREGATVAAEAGVDALSGEPRPRSVVVTGMGGSGISGDVLAALASGSAPVPVVVHRGYGLPAWVGAADLVAAISCSGRTGETLSAAVEAGRRGARVFGVGAPASPLAEVVSRAGGLYVGVQVGGRTPRASLWALCLPLLVAADRLGIHELPVSVVEATAGRLERIAQRCRPDSESFVNPAKELALQLAESLPMIWGASSMTAVAASRLVAQLAENAKYPAVLGTLPEANHNQIVSFEGPLAGVPADLFADRVDSAPAHALRLVLMREEGEHPQVRAQADASAELAAERGVPVSELRAEGASGLERLASLIGLADFASVYLALALGVDPTPVSAIDTLKSRVGAPRAST